MSDIRSTSGSSASSPSRSSVIVGTSDLEMGSDGGAAQISGSSSQIDPLGGDGPRTVVNPERRARGRSDFAAGVESSTLRRLFPTDSQLRNGFLGDPSGIQLEHFEVLERIGSGGMSAVFKARDTRLDRLVALKVLAPEQSRDGEAVQRFLNEARAAARLNHPNIVKSFHGGVIDGVHFIAYEYVEGEHLRDHIRRHGRPDVREAVNITIQIALALQHAESLGIVHRDIKPSNIVVTPRRQAKLIDLGLARQPTLPGEELTIAGTTLGTFDYVSPEQARDPRDVDVRSDVYSLGCTLYHMLTGEPPYPEGTMLQKLLDHQGKTPPNPAAINPRVPPSLASLCQRMMASQPRRRPPNAEALLRELAAVAAELGLQASQPEGLVWGVPQPRSSFWERHLGWMTTVGLLLAIVFALEGFPGSTPTEPRGDRRSSTPRERVPPAADGGTAANRAADALGEKSTDVEPEKPEPSDDGSAASGAAVAESTGSPKPREGAGETANVVDEGTNDGEKTPPATSVTDDGPTTSTGPAFSIVSKVGEPLRAFSSLAGAVSAASDGDVVELAYDGPRVEGPIRVVGKSITIRAASGFHPTIRFEPEDVPGDTSRTRMITVSKGAVDLVNLDVVLAVDDASVFSTVPRWSLFALHGAERVEIRRVRVTVENPSGREVAVIDLLENDERPSSVGGMKMMQPGGAADSERTDVRIEDTFVRGNADVVVVERTRPIRLDFENSLFAVDRSVVRVLGSNRPPGETDAVDVRLAHTTAIVSGGLIRFESGEFPRYLPPVQVSARNNVFGTRAEAPLVDGEGSTDLQDFRNLLRWIGVTNFYDGFRIFWSTPPSQPLSSIRDVDYEGWRKLWSSTGAHGSVTWVHAPSTSGFETTLPSDYAFDPEAISNPAIGGATDGTDAGAELHDVGPPGL